MGVKYADSDLLRLAGGSGAGVAQRHLYVGIDAHVFTRPNRNGFAVSEAFIDNIAANSGKYTCLP